MLFLPLWNPTYLTIHTITYTPYCRHISILPTIKQQQVAIVKDASNKDTSAFSPNPVQIQPGTTVVWSNNDNTPHTITSGMGLNDTNKGKAFDSGPIAIGKTYSHKFDVAGTYDYFCTLHPTMVGTISVK